LSALMCAARSWSFIWGKFLKTWQMSRFLKNSQA